MASFWQKTTAYLQRFRPGRLKPPSLPQWLTVDEAEMAEILTTVRAQLPTTEALLVGKPQSGKSSIVRGLTGVSADIIGQGFRPHTQRTQQYAYPSDDVPLVIFTDTVGLGEVNQDGDAMMAEWVQELSPVEQKGNEASTQQAKILIVTVKINDFAIAFLRDIVGQLRQQNPSIPCLLAVTCIHDVYPSTVDNHPPYPPPLPEVDRAFAALKTAFDGVCDRAVLLDFTLEDDGYIPVFYGLEPLRDALAELLPEAEARAMVQLLEGNLDVSQQLGSMYRDVGRRYMAAFATAAATLAAVPLPFATMPVLTALQVSMVGLLGKLYGQTISPSQAGGIVSAIAGGFLAQAVGRELIKFVPGLGSVVAASWAAAYTWALGEGACVYFGELMGGKTPDPDTIQQVMNDAFKDAKARFTQR